MNPLPGREIDLKVVICYESKYGNTMRLAQAIAEELRRAGQRDVTVTEVKRADVDALAACDLILLGGPTHFGGPTRRVTKFIEALAARNMSGKSIAAFDTYLEGDFEKSVKKMEAQIRTTVPGLRIRAPGLSIRVADMKGPIVDGELEKCKGFVGTLVPQPVLP